MLRLLLIVVALLAFACSSETPVSDSLPTSTDTATELPGTQTPAADDTAVPSIVLPSFDLADYENGDDIAALVTQVGEERAFPRELGMDSPELPMSAVQSIVREFLNDSRVVSVQQGFRDIKVVRVEDYCDNGFKTALYLGSTRNGMEFPGVVTPWNAVHSDLTPWNSPYITNSYPHLQAAYYSRGTDALGYGRLNPPTETDFGGIGINNSTHIRVFDNPACSDPRPLTEFDAAAWNLLNIGKVVEWPPELRPSSPPLDSSDLVKRWTEAADNLLTFDNINGNPWVYNCNGKGVQLNRRFPPQIGEVFTWRIEDASEHVNNAAWYVIEFDNPGVTSSEPFFMTAPEENLPFEQVFAVELTDCSIAEGLAMAETVLSRLDDVP